MLLFWSVVRPKSFITGTVGSATGFVFFLFAENEVDYSRCAGSGCVAECLDT